MAYDTEPNRNPETRRAWKIAYRKKHRERLNAYNRQRRANNPEHFRATERKYRENNLEKRRVQGRQTSARYAAEYRAKKRAAAQTEAYKTKKRQWRIAHPEYTTNHNERRRANKLAAPMNDLTVAQWREIKEHYGQCCVYCGITKERLTQDHIIPLSKGGSHTASNVVPACRACNTRKSDNAPLKPVQPLLLTIAKPRKAS